MGAFWREGRDLPVITQPLPNASGAGAAGTFCLNDQASRRLCRDPRVTFIRPQCPNVLSAGEFFLTNNSHKLLKSWLAFVRSRA